MAAPAIAQPIPIPTAPPVEMVDLGDSEVDLELLADKVEVTDVEGEDLAETTLAVGLVEVAVVKGLDVDVTGCAVAMFKGVGSRLTVPQ